MRPFFVTRISPVLRAVAVSVLPVVLATSGAQAADLLTLYREAATQDPAVTSAQAALLAARERVTQAEAANGVAVRLLTTDRALDEFDLEGFLVRHGNLRGWRHQLKISSTDLPRLAATSAAVVERLSASNVARTML